MHFKDISATVLAGGDSKRMKRDKALMRLGPDVMIVKVVESLRELFDDIVIVTNTPKVYAPLLDGVSFTKDIINTPQKNSLVGLYTGLKVSKTPYTFVVACDMPFLNSSLIKFMIENIIDEDIIIPLLGKYYEPLHAIYHKNCLNYIEYLLNTHQYSIKKLIYSGKFTVKTIGEDIIKKYDPRELSFLNINTPDEYIKALNLYDYLKP